MKKSGHLCGLDREGRKKDHGVKLGDHQGKVPLNTFAEYMSQHM